MGWMLVPSNRLDERCLPQKIEAHLPLLPPTNFFAATDFIKVGIPPIGHLDMVNYVALLLLVFSFLAQTQGWRVSNKVGRPANQGSNSVSLEGQSMEVEGESSFTTQRYSSPELLFSPFSKYGNASSLVAERRGHTS